MFETINDILKNFVAFEKLENNSIRVFNYETCDKCGKKVAAPNSMNISMRDTDLVHPLCMLLEEGGMIFHPTTPDEIFHCDALDCAVCSDCYVEEDNE